MITDPKETEFVMGVMIQEVPDGSITWTNVILQRRAEEPSRGLWSLITGKVDKGENSDLAIVREVREETGITTELSDWRYAGFITGEDSDRLPHSPDWLMHVYFCQIDKLDPFYLRAIERYPRVDSAGMIQLITVGKNRISYLPELLDEMDRLSFLVLTAALSDLNSVQITLDL